MSASERNRRLFGDVALCLGFPVIMLPLLYVVQGHRYDITESIGCTLDTYPSWPGVALRFILVTAVAFTAMIYAGKPSIQHDRYIT